MPNVTFTYDSQDFSSLCFVNRVGRDLLVPQVISSVTTHDNGAIFTKKRDDIAIIPVEIALYETSLTAFHALKRLVSSYLRKSEPKQLIFSDEADKYISTILSGNSPLDLLALNGMAVLNFQALEPYWYAVTDDTYNGSGSGNHNFTRAKGNINSLPKISIEAGEGSGDIQIILNGTEINFTGEILADETLIIDCRDKTAYIEDSESNTSSALNNIDSLEFFEAIAGVNSFYVISSDFDLDDITVEARSRWV